MLSHVQLFATPRIGACQAPLEYVAVPSSRESSGPQGLRLCLPRLLHWHVDSLLLNHRGSPLNVIQGNKTTTMMSRVLSDVVRFELKGGDGCFLFFVFLFRPRPTAFGISVPQPGIKPGTPAVEHTVLTTGPPGKFQYPLKKKNALNYALKPWKLSLSIGLTFLTNLIRKFS